MSGLRVEDITAGYGRMDVLRSVDLHLHPGEMVALLGRNGAGKTTLLRTIAGLQAPREGRISIGDTGISGRAPWRVARSGVTLVLEGARVFPTQTVAENIIAGRLHTRDAAAADRRVDALLDTFPVLRTKSASLAGSLSGGERMQLAIVQALAASPRYLLLDEPSVGLSPALVRTVFDLLNTLRREGDGDQRLGILVAEQMVAPVLRVVDRAIVLDRGGVVTRGTASELRDDPALVETYLGTAGV